MFVCTYCIELFYFNGNLFSFVNTNLIPCTICMPTSEFTFHNGVVMFYPCLFCPSDNVWRSRHADAPRCAHFSTVITPSWITEKISIEQCTHQGASVHWEPQLMFKMVTWTKQTWKKHHNSARGYKKSKLKNLVLLSL